ncbi:MAG: phosphatidate cytidylyltransferase [Peptostreptococcaceae bacterium]|nr:phosphatidate cytidylyltransferase [Peptostreptococcaceae bacterium]
MKTRVLSGLIMVPLILIIYFGGYVLLAAGFVLSLIAIREFYNGFTNAGIKPSYNIAYVALIALYAIQMFMPSNMNLIVLWLVLVVMAGLIYGMDVVHRGVSDGMATVLGIIYVIFFLYHLILIDNLGEYSILAWLVIITAFCTDIFAYFSGYLFGKHKLAPNLSPKKTIEGAIGGAIGSIIFSGIFGYFVVPRLLIHCIIIGLIGGICSQFGDLTASALKRKMDVKDYGNLIPGHGGIMDRFDSVIFMAPIIYYYTIFIIG